MHYPSSPGTKSSVDTTQQAAQEIALSAPMLRARVVETLTIYKPGLTADEVATVMDVDRLSIRPRLSELKRMGEVEDSGLRRENASGKKAIVWRLIFQVTQGKFL